MKEPVLVILAAGMGSRYGGLKQIDTVGSNGESIIDFSIYDAIRAGFKKVMLIIREEHEEAFRRSLTDKIEKKIEVEFDFFVDRVAKKMNETVTALENRFNLSIVLQVVTIILVLVF